MIRLLASLAAAGVNAAGGFLLGTGAFTVASHVLGAADDLPDWIKIGVYAAAALGMLGVGFLTVVRKLVPSKGGHDKVMNADQLAMLTSQAEWRVEVTGSLREITRATTELTRQLRESTDKMLEDIKDLDRNVDATRHAIVQPLTAVSGMMELGSQQADSVERALDRIERKLEDR